MRTQSVGDRNLYVIGGRRLDQNFLASLVLPSGMRALLYRNLEANFVPTALADASGPVPQADLLQPLIEQVQKQSTPQTLITTIHCIFSNPASSETFHAMPLTGTQW